MKKIVAAFCLVFLALTPTCSAEGLGTLIEVAKSQAEIQEQYADETRAFERVRKAIESGAIAKGQTKSSVQSGYGKPVVAIKDLDGKREVWIYKPATSSFFKGVRAALVFTQQDILDDARIDDIKEGG